jgi:hypothetical protein
MADGSKLSYGEVSERLIEQPWKGCVGLALPRVRIPPSPFFFAFAQNYFYNTNDKNISLNHQS